MTEYSRKMFTVLGRHNDYSACLQHAREMKAEDYKIEPMYVQEALREKCALCQEKSNMKMFGKPFVEESRIIKGTLKQLIGEARQDKAVESAVVSKIAEVIVDKLQDSIPELVERFWTESDPDSIEYPSSMDHLHIASDEIGSSVAKKIVEEVTMVASAIAYRTFRKLHAGAGHHKDIPKASDTVRDMDESENSAFDDKAIDRPGIEGL